MKIWTIAPLALLMLAAILFAGGCNTVEGVGKDVEGVGKAVQDVAQ